MVSLQPFFPSMLAEIMDLFAKGVFKVMPIREFSIGEIAEAFKYMSRREHIGKIVLCVSGEPVWLTLRRPS
jgi:NADPH:quinone reductase-like Zn-dependent oxidoreductase